MSTVSLVFSLSNETNSLGDPDRTGEQVGMAILGDKMERDHGAPWHVVHVSGLYTCLGDFKREIPALFF